MSTDSKNTIQKSKISNKAKHHDSLMNDHSLKRLTNINSQTLFIMGSIGTTFILAAILTNWALYPAILNVLTFFTVFSVGRYAWFYYTLEDYAGVEYNQEVGAHNQNRNQEHQVDPNKFQPRFKFDEQGLKSLTITNAKFIVLLLLLVILHILFIPIIDLAGTFILLGLAILYIIVSTARYSWIFHSHRIRYP